MTGEEKQFYGIDSLRGEMRTSREAQNSSSKNTHVKMIEERNVLYYIICICYLCSCIPLIIVKIDPSIHSL